MRVLALEPYYGGSHRAFLDGWIQRSRHDWDLYRLPAHQWKWRMRHSALTLAREIAGRGPWDVVFCTDMLDLAQLRGFAPEIADLPCILYFHENQWTYPVEEERERDLHFGLTNFLSAAAADEIWWNSAYHRDEFLGAARKILRRMPDYRPLEEIDRIRARSSVRSPAIAPFPPRPPRRKGPLRVVWAARWEFDKDPESFFAAVEALEDGGDEFVLSVVGQSFQRVPEVFARAQERFAHRIARWGYQENRRDYERALLEADVFVSTARHEFFGLSAVEAACAGTRPLLPRRLAYPDVLGELPADCFYDDLQALIERLRTLACGDDDWDPQIGRRIAAPYTWPVAAPRLDQALAEAAQRAVCSSTSDQ